MGIRLPSMIVGAKRVLKRKSFVVKEPDVPKKGYIAVYVGKCQKKRFVVPVMYINHPSFGDLLNRAEAEFGFYHPMGGLTIPCEEGAFIDLTSQLPTS
ncbi:hypothetical protein K2173_017920 [Erythroxylum novogranatense]|uniref:Small auxin up regulated protein n=1 Tax=Erythroxylum novogranatense TaxID=1862640 RepID=A0AAV8TL06_9ROSI|nr:hypothetical protein K2173_017920 [Erythroxylum novogranatense]